MLQREKSLHVIINVSIQAKDEIEGWGPFGDIHIHEYIHHSVLGLGFFFLELRRFLFEKNWLFCSQCEPTL